MNRKFGALGTIFATVITAIFFAGVASATLVINVEYVGDTATPTPAPGNYGEPGTTFSYIDNMGKLQTYTWTNDWDFMYKVTVEECVGGLMLFRVNNPYQFDLIDGNFMPTEWTWFYHPILKYAQWHTWTNFIHQGEIGYFAFRVDGATPLIVGSVTIKGENGSTYEGTSQGPTPEPATLFLFGGGLAGLAIFIRRKTKQR